MSKKNSGLSGVFVAIFGVILVVRIVMIMGRNAASGAQQSWNSTYLIWSIFLLVVIVGSYIYQQNKKSAEEEEE